MMGKEELVSDGLASLEEAMAFLSVGRTTLYELMDSGALVYCKVRRRRCIPRKALVEYAKLALRGGGTVLMLSMEAPISSPLKE